MAEAFPLVAFEKRKERPTALDQHHDGQGQKDSNCPDDAQCLFFHVTRMRQPQPNVATMRLVRGLSDWVTSLLRSGITDGNQLVYLFKSLAAVDGVNCQLKGLLIIVCQPGNIDARCSIQTDNVPLRAFLTLENAA